MTKKISTAAFLVIFSVMQSAAQISFGIKAGVNLANAKDIVSAINKPSLAFNAGLLAEIDISNKFIARPELLYSVKGFKFVSTPFSGAGTLSLNYISVPLLAGFKPDERFTIFFGPECSFLTKAISRFDGNSHDVSGNYRKFDIAADAGVACSINNRLGVEIRYSYGLGKLADVTAYDNVGNMLYETKIGRNHVFSGGLFYKFSGKK